MPNEQTKTLAKTSSPYEALGESDKMLVDMRVLRMPMSKIAAMSSLNYSYVRQLFMTGGRLYEAYIYRMREIRAEYGEHYINIGEELKDLSVDAIQALRRAVNGRGMTSVIAAKDILDRAGIGTEELPQDNEDEPEEQVIVYMPENGRDQRVISNKAQ